MEVKVNLSLCYPRTEHITVEEISIPIDGYFNEKDINWSNCYRLRSTDGGKYVSGCYEDRMT